MNDDIHYGIDAMVLCVERRIARSEEVLDSCADIPARLDPASGEKYLRGVK